MELNIVKPDSNDFCEAVDISRARQQELSGALDAMVRRTNSGPMHLEKMHDVYSEIASFCNTNAELMYCTTLHCGWHARRGRILAPGPLNYAVIALGIQQLYDRLRKDLYSNNATRKIMEKLVTSEEDEVLKEGAREGVMRLFALQEDDLARDIINKLTGFAF